MSGTLYVVGTPIGNLGDLSPRAIETLQAVDFIAAEDTRVTLKLLNHFDIKKPMVSYYEHNLHQRGEMIIGRILQGENCAIVTDAGMPCISDPGEDLVALCAQHGIPTVVVPGPSAVISALAVSGLPTSRFSFEGFLTVNKRGRKEHLQSLVDDPHTLIFYEAPHKLSATLKDMLEVLGDRPISLVRELTKLHEEVLRTTLAQAAAYYEQNPPRGEFVLVVAGAQPRDTKDEVTFEEAVEMVRTLQRQQDLPASEAARRIAKETGYKKSELYKSALG